MIDQSRITPRGAHGLRMNFERILVGEMEQFNQSRGAFGEKIVVGDS